MVGNFLAVDKNLLGKGLQPIDILIIAQIQEFERTNECFATNQQFADWFGVSTKTIERALDRLEELKYIKRDTKIVSNNGQKSKQRKIKASDKMTVGNDKQPTKCPEATVNLSESNRQNDAIKDNLKDNLKENLREKETASAERELEELSDQELNELGRRYRAKEKYAVLYKDFQIKSGSLSKELPAKIDAILKERHKEEIQAKQDAELDRVFANSAAFSNVDLEAQFRRGQELRKKEQEKKQKTFDTLDVPKPYWLESFETETGISL